MLSKIRKILPVLIAIVALFISTTFMSQAATALKITKQPASAMAASGKKVSVTVKASGDGLKYKWYYKNSGKSKYSVDKSNTGSTYSVKMSKSINGRKIYCVVTDKNGKSVKSSVATLKMGKAAKISSVSASCGSTVKVTVKASGDGLKYKWYYKDSGKSKYKVAKKVTGKTYSSNVKGRKVYCVVKDKYGNSVKSQVVTVQKKHSYNVKVLKAATCREKGKATYTCKYCTNSYTKATDKKSHSYGAWKTVVSPTASSKGYERRTCKVCSYYKDRTLAKLKAKWYITAKTGTETIKYGVAENGKYNLDKPRRTGYVFKGWKTSDGKTFSSSGTLKANATVTAVWEVDGTDTVDELMKYIDAGVDQINITSDIVITKPIYITRAVKIYSDKNAKLIRDPSYTGDI
ncbi:MAG: hypothetical protein IKV21_01695, partial [Clostridia bacterium]|nr:hypothetical protein [Clostridia bacterium]